MAVPISLVVEGLFDEVVMRRVLREFGAGPELVLGREGKSFVDANLQRYIGAARKVPGSRWLIVRDLDHDAACVPELIEKSLRLAQRPPSNSLLVVAVRQIEAWLLADRDGISAFLGVPRDKLPQEPEATPDAKSELVGLVRKYTRDRELVAAVAGSPDRSEGPAYVYRMREFVDSSWDVRGSAQRAASLERLLARLPGLLS